MSKTTQAKKAAKAKEAQNAVEVPSNVEGQKAPESSPETQKIETAQESPTTEVTESETRAEKAPKVRGKKYQQAKAKVDIDKYYPLPEAVKLVKETSIAKFDAKVEAHLVTLTEPGNLGEISFPHLETAAKRIAVVDDKILAELKAGEINFDILVATPATMPKVLPFARILGPKGLMPNPKNGTLTDNPDEAIKKLSVAKTQVRTEKKAPVTHLVVGKVSQPEKELEDNVTELIKVIGPLKIKKLVLTSTMGPGIKVAIER